MNRRAGNGNKPAAARREGARPAPIVNRPTTRQPERQPPRIVSRIPVRSPLPTTAAVRGGRPQVQLLKPLRDSIEKGHPWVYARAAQLPAGAVAGDVAVVVDERGALATAYVDPDSPIAARIIDLDPTATIDARWASARATAAARSRVTDPLLASTDGLRWIHGENDGMPGLVIDGYAGVAVVVYDGGGAARFWTPRLPAVLDGLRSGGARIDFVWVRDEHGVGNAHALGAEPPDEVVIREGDARFVVDVRLGQKTGFFLDQRRNRALIGELSAANRVLNVFSYTGGFSVHAGLGGATQVTSVDIAAPAIAAAAENFRRSGLDAGRHEFVADDAFLFFDAARARGRQWDVIITDPPSFAPREDARPRAITAYRRVAAAAISVLAPGGRLAFASCSSHVHEADLLAVLADAGRGRGVRVRHIAGAASDHPVLPAFPEGRYLKFILVDLVT